MAAVAAVLAVLAVLAGVPDDVLRGLFADPSQQTRSWWAPSVAQVLGHAEALAKVSGPRELEQATAEMVGGRLHRALAEEEAGFALPAWLAELIDAAGRARGDGAWYLLHGLAAIAPQPLEDQAMRWIARARARRECDPAWLAATPTVVPTGEVFLLRDGYGTRFGVLIRCRRDLAEAVDEHVFSLDVDTCTSVVHVVDAGVYDDSDTAAAAWRHSVGAPASSAAVEQADPVLLAALLPDRWSLERVVGNESRRQMDNYFRGVRRAADLAEWFAATGRPFPDVMRHAAAADPYQDAFTSWYTSRHGQPPDTRITGWVIEEWLEGALDQTHLACSPHRVACVVNRIVLDWRSGPETETALALLPDWVDWCADQTGLDPALAQRAHATARQHTSAARSREHPAVFGTATPE